ncbi:MAG TPA: hypothetical protein GXZ82_08685 [Firmicutes bacterium]|nr:hypothetical protein [Bacillota bacterium]
MLTNTQGAHLFFETFSGNNLMMYPRGVVVYGYFDALGGVRLDAVRKTIQADPLHDQLEVPILWCADWEAGVAPVISEGMVEDGAGLIERSGLQLMSPS